MLFLDDVGITVFQDHRNTWRFGDLHRGFRSVAIHITDEDRQRAFDSAQAVANYFRQQYGQKLLVGGVRLRIRSKADHGSGGTCHGRNTQATCC